MARGRAHGPACQETKVQALLKLPPQVSHCASLGLRATSVTLRDLDSMKSLLRTSPALTFYCLVAKQKID